MCALGTIIERFSTELFVDKVINSKRRKNRTEKLVCRTCPETSKQTRGQRLNGKRFYFSRFGIACSSRKTLFLRCSRAP